MKYKYTNKIDFFNPVVSDDESQLPLFLYLYGTNHSIGPL
jgi:hypothetical protein